MQYSRREMLALSLGGVATAGLGPLARPAPTTSRPHAAPLAMWALTGTLKSDDVSRQLDAFAGVGWGVVLYPRWGLELEYLGMAWFERIRFIVEQAAARKMEVWLYDEFCWPSGHAKGLVTKDHPELQAQLLAVERDGTSRIVPVAGSANLLLPQATARFLAVTHERYARAIGEFFGRTVRAIFTDEPSLARQHQPRKPGEAPWQLTWSALLDQALGGDFPKRLAQAGEVARAPLWRDYWAAYTRVFHDAWVAPIAKWCTEHKIAMSGHLLGEHSFGSQVACNGSLRRQLGAFEIPGIDEIHTRTDPAKCEALTLAAIAELAGRERMVEVYALGPPTMSLATMKNMVDLCAACGVDRYVLAICPHDLRGGMFKREYLGIHGPQQPWFREAAKAYGEYVVEAAATARTAKPLGVPWPSDEELWAAAGPDPLRSEPLKAMTQQFVTAARERICARLKSGPTPAAVRRPMDAAWTFQPAGPNSLRLDTPELNVLEVPAVAELSVQTQLVRQLRVNGAPVNLNAAPPDREFDLSYRRVPVTAMLRRGANRIDADLTEPKPLRFLPSLVLWGRFALDAQGRIIAPPRAIKLGDWRPQGYPDFCGTGRYRTEFQLDALPRFLCIDSGDYPASVTWNGRPLGLRAWSPYRFALAGAARVGVNEVIIEVTSTLGHLMTPKAAPPVGLLNVWTE